MLVIQQFEIPGVFLITPPRHGDARGWFSETYNHRAFRDALGDLVFVQDNQSFSAAPGTLRGLHYQTPPAAQDKLVRVLQGSVLDVAVDIRHGSPTFGRHVSAVLSADNGAQLFVPKGFAHGYLTLEPDTEVLYKVSAYYSREHEAGIAWDDPALAISWGVDAVALTIAARDAAFPSLRDAARHFSHTQTP
jgi:dTDP-4-dehydrorhamnose 3,5-epimerase